MFLKAIACFLFQKIKCFPQDDRGQTMVEYVTLIVLVALSVFMLTPNVKSAIISVFSNTSSALKTGSGS